MTTTALLVVDVQPAFNASCQFIAAKVAKHINSTRIPVIIMWVGDGLTDDDEQSVHDYLVRHGARREKLSRCRFLEKGYGELRAWMGTVDREHIVTAGKALLAANGCNSTEMLDLAAIFGGDVDLPVDPLFKPSFGEAWHPGVDALQTCGGGNNECLAEVELWLDIKSVPYTRLDHLVYG